MERCERDGDEQPGDQEPKIQLTEQEKELDSFYYLQDLILIANEMGIGKRELLEDYYLDEFIMLLKRNRALRERWKRQADADGKKQDGDEEVYWDQMNFKG